MRPPRGGQLVPSGRRQHREGAPRIRVARLALDELLALQAVDEARQAAAAEQDRRGEVVHPHAAFGRIGDVHEDLVRGHRQAVLVLELGVERLDQARVHAEQAAPGAQLALAEELDAGWRARHRPTQADATTWYSCARNYFPGSRKEEEAPDGA